ncbi:tautomerase family protein [Streptomyces sp. SAS_270]|uniref:tautomerase family protein n=1 Tax=Streptomyces sp. SAS_270 TaxID=3412748 RepID=UPI00403CD02F
MPFANFKVPAGSLTPKQKEQIVHRTTDLYADIYGDHVRPNTMVLVEEVADGGWGIAGDVLILPKSEPESGEAARDQ